MKDRYRGRVTSEWRLWPARMGLLLLAACLALLLPVAAWAAGQGETDGQGIVTVLRPFDVRHYDVRLEPDLAAGTLRGRVAIDLDVTADGVAGLDFDVGALTVDAVRQGSKSLRFQLSDSRLHVMLARPARPGKRIRLEVDYHGAPQFGLEFHPERGEIYTIFSTSQWMVCIDAPDERASLDLRLVLPADARMIGNGREVSVREQRDGRRLHHWRLSESVPSFVYGFAAGRYREVATQDGKLALRYLSAVLDEAQLRKVFADTSDMIRFFGDKTGIPYHGLYSQALVARTIGQEMAGLAVMSEAYGQGVLDGSNDTALIAHEVAHQWWGVSVTCRDWGHFWLNEGLANFMAAAYLQHRYGESAYQERVDAWKKRVDRLRTEGKDHALVYTQWTSPSADDRAVVYIKGAYVFAQLREELGEEGFWNGIRVYTQANQMRSVITADLRAAMERGSGRDLSAFFARWVDAER